MNKKIEFWVAKLISTDSYYSYDPVNDLDSWTIYSQDIWKAVRFASYEKAKSFFIKPDFNVNNFEFLHCSLELKIKTTKK